jgi:hypothetical protein
VNSSRSYRLAVLASRGFYCAQKFHKNFRQAHPLSLCKSYSLPLCSVIEGGVGFAKRKMDLLKLVEGTKKKNGNCRFLKILALL